MRGGFAIIAHKRVVTAGPPLIRPTATFSLRAKSRLRRLRSDTRLRAQPPGGRHFHTKPRQVCSASLWKRPSSWQSCMAPGLAVG